MITSNKNALLIAGIIFLAILMGMFTVVFAGVAEGRFGILLAFPALILIVALFLYDRYLLFAIIILFRSAMDPILDATKLGGFGLGAVLNALVIFIAMISLFQNAFPVRKVVKQTWLAFLILSFISIFYAPAFIDALKTYLALLSYAAVFVLAITVIRNESDYGRWMRLVFLSSLIPVAYGFINIAMGGFANANGFRINSTFSHPNIYAFYLVLMISIGFYFIKAKVSYIPDFWRRMIPIYIFLMLLLLVMTKTRSAWVGCFAFFTFYVLLYERKYIVLLLLAPVVAFLIPEIRDRIMDLGQGNEVINYSKLNSYAWRKLIWHDGLHWMEPIRYFFGYGLEAFKYYSKDFFTMGGGGHNGAHSVLVQLFFETGFFGLIAFIWLHLKTALLLKPFYKINKLMIFSAIMFLLEFALDAYSDNMLAYLSYNWYLWFVLGAAYAVNFAKQQEKLQNTSVEKTNVYSKRLI